MCFCVQLYADFLILFNINKGLMVVMFIYGFPHTRIANP